MEREWTSRVEQPRAQVEGSPGKMPAAGFFLGAVIALIVVANFTLADASIRLNVLRGILILMAVGEGLLGGVSQVFFARRSSEREGRPYDPAYHAVMQDFGFYHLAFAALFGLAAFDPKGSTTVIAVAIAFYAVHGMTHILRYFGLYYGGGTPIPTRPRQIDWQQGLTLIAAATGMALFFP